MAWLRINTETPTLTLDALYSTPVLRLAAQAHGAGDPAAGDTTVTCVNPVCGDRIDLGLSVSGGKVSYYAYRTQACVICQASASALGQTIEGLDGTEVAALRVAIEAMLAGETAAPGARFAPFAALSPVASEPGRHTCVLLPLNAVREALARLAEPG